MLLLNEGPQEEGKDEEHNFPCDLCEKVCKLKRRLGRHKTTKHKNESILSVGEDSSRTSNPKKAAESILHPLKLKKMIMVSVSKLAKDECYPEDILQKFSIYNFNLKDDGLFAFSCVKPAII